MGSKFWGEAGDSAVLTPLMGWGCNSSILFWGVHSHVSECLKTLLEVPRLVVVRCQSRSACAQNLADALFHSPQTFQAVSKLLYFWSASAQGLANPCVHALGLEKEFGH